MERKKTRGNLIGVRGKRTQHMLNLSPERQDDQDQPINDQDGPKDGQIENLTPTATEAQNDGARRAVPELELG